MKNHVFANHRTQWIIGIATLLFVLACNSIQQTPTTKITEVTQVVPVTQIVQATQFIPVTRIVRVTRVVEVPTPTQAPVQPAVPAPTEILAFPSTPPIVPIIPQNNNDLLVWYNFEDDFLATGYVSDISGNGFDAQINGTVQMDNGISGGRAIFFSGDAYILAPINPAIGRNIVSFSLWFKTDYPENNYKLASNRVG